MEKYLMNGVLVVSFLLAASAVWLRISGHSDNVDFMMRMITYIFIWILYVMYRREQRKH